jgi:hypothetical protein
MAAMRPKTMFGCGICDEPARHRLTANVLARRLSDCFVHQLVHSAAKSGGPIS